jgi:membrane protease YdiL (CAAX protease family)
MEVLLIIIFQFLFEVLLHALSELPWDLFILSPQTTPVAPQAPASFTFALSDIRFTYAAPAWDHLSCAAVRIQITETGMLLQQGLASTRKAPKLLPFLTVILLPSCKPEH